MIYTLTLNPALDKTAEIPNFSLDKVNRTASIRTDAGGKGINVSKVIKKMGGESIALGILGGGSGKKIKDMLDTSGIKSNFTFTDAETRTNLKIADPINRTYTDINESGDFVAQSVIDSVTDSLLTQLKPDDILIVAGSLPKGAPDDTYQILRNKSNKTGAKVFFDADGRLLENGIKALPFLIKPNRDELSSLVGKPLETLDEVKKAALKLVEKGIKKVVVSLGKDGALFVTENEIIYAEAIPVEVKSTVGAGDSVVAALALSEMKMLTLEETARLCTATGAANVMSEGTKAADFSLIQKLLPQVKLQRL